MVRRYEMGRFEQQELDEIEARKSRLPQPCKEKKEAESRAKESVGKA